MARDDVQGCTNAAGAGCAGAATMYGPSIKQSDGSWKKTFLIAFIDDASRVITHGEFFYNDNTENMVDAFRTALFKRGKPDRLYFDNGSNYKSKEILQACIRLDILLSHAPVRDGRIELSRWRCLLDPRSF